MGPGIWIKKHEYVESKDWEDFLYHGDSIEEP